MPNENHSTPISRTPGESGLEWLLQPTWEKDLFGEIADATQMTPALLEQFEKALIESDHRPPILASSCQSLTKCGTFEGLCTALATSSPCPILKECDKFTGTAITGTKGTKVGTVGTAVIKKKKGQR